LITSTSQSPVQAEFTEPEQQIFSSMTALLGRADLGYQGGFVDVNGQQIHYLDYGEGPPVLLLHGGGSGSAIWFRQIEMLSKTRRVIAPDHPVFGLSSQIAYELPLTDSMVTYLTGFMDALSLSKVDIVALSMGAQAVLALATEKPERIGKMIVIDSAGLGRAFPPVFRLVNVPLLGRFIVRPNRWGQDNYFKTMEVVNSEFADAPAYRQYAYSVTLSVGHARAMRASLQVITSLGGQRQIFGDAELCSIAVPTLVIWGARDQVFPVKHGYRLAELVPGARLHVIENAAHVPLLDNPDQVNGLISGFLEGD
jgi:pimeloyl-ACP methyl ester carboxylesterase